jgi:hypothetical protein
MSDVSKMTITTKEREVRCQTRKSYTRPLLIEFGPVGMLTQSGSAGLPEFNDNGMCNNNPNRAINPQC